MSPISRTFLALEISRTLAQHTRPVQLLPSHLKPIPQRSCSYRYPMHASHMWRSSWCSNSCRFVTKPCLLESLGHPHSYPRPLPQTENWAHSCINVCDTISSFGILSKLLIVSCHSLIINLFHLGSLNNSTEQCLQLCIKCVRTSYVDFQGNLLWQLTCVKASYISPSINCPLSEIISVIVSCGQPGIPSNGRVDTSAGTSVGDVARYSCDKGYRLIGLDETTCQADGRWNGSVPTCERELARYVCTV